MTLNEDNELARFLLAVVMQKDLRDINWDQVASDPILLKPICTGHAARMRFARFRNLVTGQSSARKRQHAEGGARVAKAKKAKKQEPKTVVKSEFTPNPSICDLPSPSPAHSYRLLTPCSVNATKPRGSAELPAEPDEGQARVVSQLLPSPDSEGTCIVGLGRDRADPPLVPAFDAAFEMDMSFDSVDDVDANPTTSWDSRFDDEFQF